MKDEKHDPKCPPYRHKLHIALGIFYLAIGLAVLLFGVAGMLLPVIPGIPIAILGLVIIAKGFARMGDHRLTLWIKLQKQWLKKKLKDYRKAK